MLEINKFKFHIYVSIVFYLKEEKKNIISSSLMEVKSILKYIYGIFYPLLFFLLKEENTQHLLPILVFLRLLRQKLLKRSAKLVNIFFLLLLLLFLFN